MLNYKVFMCIVYVFSADLGNKQAASAFGQIATCLSCGYAHLLRNVISFTWVGSETCTSCAVVEPAWAKQSPPGFHCQDRGKSSTSPFLIVKDPKAISEACQNDNYE